MSLLLAAALSGHGVSNSADICRVDSWSPPSIVSAAVYQPQIGYIPPFADTPSAHAQTRHVARIFNEGSAATATAEEKMVMLNAYAFRAQLCGYGIRSALHMVRPVRGLSTTLK